MKIDAHLMKFRRLDAMKQRLDVAADRELWIWTAMNAATHLLNAALHHSGASAETDSFHTQVEGVYAAPDRASGALCIVRHSPGDVMHVGQPPLGCSLPCGIEEACAALRIIEDLRESCVRGSEPFADDAAQHWELAYAKCVAALFEALATPRRQVT